MKQCRHLRVLCSVLLLSLLLPLACACAPRSSDIAPRVEWLLRNSAEINEVIWGEGLPVWAKDSEFARENHLYDDFEEGDYYDFVTDESPYLSAEQIKIEAERYYSKEFLESTVYPQLFDGLAIPDSAGSIAYARARFLEDGNWFYQLRGAENYFASGKLVYDFSSIRVVAPSNDDVCYVKISATLGGESVTQRVKLQKQDGVWLLASFAG